MFCTINIVRFHIPVLAKSCGYFANIIISIQFKCTYFTSSTGATQLSSFIFKSLLQFVFFLGTV